MNEKRTETLQTLILNKFLRVRILFTTAALLLLVSSLAFLPGNSVRVQAATVTPTITIANHTVRPHQTIAVTGQGFAPGDTVYLFIDMPYYDIGTLTCDNTGTCSGSFTLTYDPGVQGQHMLLGEGTQAGELVASTPIVFAPAISLVAVIQDANRGGPGTGTYLTGGAFQANETANVYWGGATGTLLGTLTTDYSGFFNFPFSVPTGVAAGKYKVTVVRSNQKPASLSATFTVLPAAFTTAAGVRSKHLLKFHLSGFQANETIAISWDANGGQQISTLRAGFNGAIDSSIGQVWIPSAPDGAYTITATGESSGLQASSPLAVGPGIQVAPSLVNSGGALTVIGGGFSSDETVTIAVVGYQDGGISTTTADDGSFQVSLTAPAVHTPNQQYTVKAVNSNGTEKARTLFSIVAPQVSWQSADLYNNGIATYGSAGTISGLSFQAYEQVNLFWNYQQAGQTEVGTITADATGSFTFSLNSPSSPFTTNARIAAIGVSSTFIATSQVQPAAAIFTTPTSTPVGQVVNVSGGSFAANATVTISLAVLSPTSFTVTSGSDGTFNTSFTVPATSQGGVFTVSASDGTVNATATLIVQVSLTLTPATGGSGTSITIQASNLNLSSFDCFASTPMLVWYNPETGTSQTVSQTCPIGRPYSVTITAPTNLVSGQSYEIELIMGGYLVGQAAFSAQ